MRELEKSRIVTIKKKVFLLLLYCSYFLVINFLANNKFRTLEIRTDTYDAINCVCHVN